MSLLSFCRHLNHLGICRHRPSSSYIRALVKRAAHNEPAMREELLISALEKYAMAELREEKGVVLCDVLDAHAFLEWLAASKSDFNNWAESFQHRRLEVLSRTLVHEGAEWTARRLDLFPELDSAFKEFLTRSRIEEPFFSEQFMAEYGMDMNHGPDGIYHLFAEACDDYRRPPLQKHLPKGVLASAAASLLKALASSGTFTAFYKRLEEQVPELPKETYALDETGHPPFQEIRNMLERRGLRIAPLKEVREVDRLVEGLNRCQRDPEGRKVAVEELTKLAPGMTDFFDIFRISSSPLVELDSGHLAAIRSRLLAHLSPGNTARRVAIVGYNQNIIAAMRRIGIAWTDHIELVAFVGQKPRDIMQWIKYNSQLGIFDEVRGDERGFLYLGKQKSAVSIYHGRLTEPGAVLRSLPWKALGVHYILISEDHARKVPGEIFDRLRREGVEIVVARTQTVESQAFISPIGSNDGPGQRTLGLLPAEEAAYALGVSALCELGNILVLGADIVEKHDDPAVVQPTYRVAGVYQVIHKKNPDRFKAVARMLGLTEGTTRMLATSEFKTNIPRGKLLRLHAVLDSRISKERIVGLFKKKARELDFLDLPEWWVQLTSNLNFGNPRIMFDPNQVYVNQNDAGTQVSIAFFLDEAMGDVEGALRFMAGHSGGREIEAAPDPFVTGTPAPSRGWAELDTAQKTEFSSRNVPTLARKYQQKGEADAIKRRARKYATSKVGTGSIPVADPKLTDDAARLLFLESQPIILQEVLKDASGEAVAMVALHENRHKVYATSLLTTASLENVHHVMDRYYAELRRYALRLSREYDWEILIHDVYEYGDKLRATIRVHHLDYNEKTGLFDRVTFLSVDQYSQERQRWQTIARPNSILYPSPPGIYNIVINAPGGRMGSCTYRIASKSDKLRVVALGGPDARRLAELLNEKDYVQGRYPGTVKYGNDWIELDGKRSVVFSHGVFRDPGNYPWKCFILMGIPIHVAIDATGRFNNLDGVSRHRRAGALRAMLDRSRLKQRGRMERCDLHPAHQRPYV